MKSIITENPNCYFCGHHITEEHHLMNGTADRKMADKYGLTIRLCPAHHRAVHDNIEVRRMLKEVAQKKFEEHYSHEEWMKVFMKNYL